LTPPPVFRRIEWFGDAAFVRVQFRAIQLRGLRKLAGRMPPSPDTTFFDPEESRSRKSAPCMRFQAMYAVIRTGGKQYRVAPGDTVKIEKSAHDNGAIEFSDIVAVSGEEGKFEQELGGAKVLAEVVSEGKGDKILVFHYKRKKQYKKMQGHRQSFVEVKINEIQVGGKSFKAEKK
jgi:large subunit ribosomal protein L21